MGRSPSPPALSATTLVLALGFVLASAPFALAAAPAPAIEPKPAAERSTRALLQAGAIAIEEANYARAQARFQEAADIDPHLAQAHFGLGLAALGAHDRRGAEKAFRLASGLSEGAPEVRYALGVTYFIFDDPRAAEEELRAAAGADRLFLEARYSLGIVAAQRGDLPAAADALNEAIRIDNGHASSHYQLGSVLARSGDLDGALRELARAMAAAPGMLDARPEDPILFIERSGRPTSSGAGRPSTRTTLGMPLPVLRPSIAWARRRPALNSPPTVAEIPDWYLYCYMALLLEDSSRWQGAVDILERALAIKDRSESLAIVADRLVDYSPHLHLAEAYHHLGNFREAFLHLGIAKNEGNASPEALRALTVLIQKDRLRPRIVLRPLPDHTADETVNIRGLVIADEAPLHVEVAGKEAILRAAGSSEIAEMLGEKDRPAREGGQTTLFEVPAFRLGAGTNVIPIRPSFRNPARDGDTIEARVVRLPPPPAAPPPTPEPPKPGPPKSSKPKTGHGKPPSKPPPPKPSTKAAEGQP